MLPVAAGILVYWGVWNNGFVWDDIALFIQNPALRSDVIHWSAISRPILEGTTYFRPLVLLSFALEFKIWGVNAPAAHLVNLFLHLANTALTYAIGVALFSRTSLSRVQLRACAAALIYAVHPSLVEPTAWLSGRFDLMATTFCLLALAADLYLKNRLLRTFALLVSFVCALGSKELGALIPGLLVLSRLIWWREGGESVSSIFRRLLAREAITILLMGLVFIGYLVLRMESVGSLAHVDQELAAKLDGPLSHALLVLNTLWFYLRLALFPFAEVAPFHPLDFAALSSFSGWLSASAGLAFVTAVGWLSYKKVPAALLIAMALFALAPVLHLVPLTIGGNIGHDRFLALPMAGLVLAPLSFTLGTPATNTRSTLAKILSILLVSWLIFAALIAKVTVPLWNNEEVLWTWVYERNPNFSPAQYKYLTVAIQRKDFAEADRIYLIAARKGYVTPQIHIAYGTSLVERGETVQGEKVILQAIKVIKSEKQKSEESTVIASQYLEAHAFSELSKISIARGDYQEALRRIEVAVALSPQVPVLNLRRALLLAAVGNVDEGRVIYKQAREMTLPAHLSQFENMAKQFVSDFCSPPNIRGSAPLCLEGIRF